MVGPRRPFSRAARLPGRGAAVPWTGPAAPGRWLRRRSGVVAHGRGLETEGTRAVAHAAGPQGPARGMRHRAQSTWIRYSRMITGIGMPTNHSRIGRMVVLSLLTGALPYQPASPRHGSVRPGFLDSAMLRCIISYGEYG